MVIDKNTYNKAKRIPYDPMKACGYEPRPTGRLSIRSLIVHTTNGHAGSRLSDEANFIETSLDISSHNLLGKEGETIEFLDPDLYIAYHAGCVKATIFSNLFAIGIEMHNTPSEGHCTTRQLQALDDLTRYYISKYNIEEQYIDTHRNVAVFCKGTKNAGQLGRKIDPSGFPDDEFYAWRRTLFTKALIQYKVIGDNVNIRSAPYIGNNIVGTLSYGDTFTSAAIKLDEHQQFINGVNTWAHLTHGTHNGKPVDGLGFIHTSNLKVIG